MTTFLSRYMYLDVCLLLYCVNFVINTILWIIGLEPVRQGMIECCGKLIRLKSIVEYCYVKWCAGWDEL